jgi:hypothetical protein
MDIHKIIADGGKNEWIKLKSADKIAVCLEGARRMNRHTSEAELYIRNIDKAYTNPELSDEKLASLLAKTVTMIDMIDLMILREQLNDLDRTAPTPPSKIPGLKPAPPKPSTPFPDTTQSDRSVQKFSKTNFELGSLYSSIKKEDLCVNF